MGLGRGGERRMELKVIKASWNLGDYVWEEREFENCEQDFLCCFLPWGNCLFLILSIREAEKLRRKDSLWSWKGKEILPISKCQGGGNWHSRPGKGVGSGKQALQSVRVLKGSALGLLQTRTRTVLTKPEISFNAPIFWLNQGDQSLL